MPTAGTGTTHLLQNRGQMSGETDGQNLVLQV
jgi:hypothetical protein